MDDFDIRCNRCGAAITHVCYTGLKETLKHLYEFKLESLPRGFNKKKKDGYTKGDEDAPFFSEAYLYNLLGEDNARTVRAVLNEFIRTMGIEPDLSEWPEPTCRHFFTQHLFVDNVRGIRIEWCETCGATRKLGLVTTPGGGVSEWVIPARNEKALEPPRTSPKRTRR